MNKNSTLSYFFDGFSLANKSFVVYIIRLFFSLPILITAFPDLLTSKFLLLLSLVIATFDIGFRLAVPIFLIEKQKNKTLNFKNIAKTTIQNTKRIIIPLTLLSILVGILAIAASVVAVLLLPPTKEQIPELTQVFRNQRQGWQPNFLFPHVILSFLVFTSIFFSLEYKGLLSAMKNSIVTSLKNLLYVALVMTAGIISYSIASFLPTEFLRLLVEIVIGTYISFVISASTLYYYQRNLKSA